MKRIGTDVFATYFTDYIGFTNSAIMAHFKKYYKFFEGWFDIKIDYSDTNMQINNLFISHNDWVGSATFFYDAKEKRWFAPNDKIDSMSRFDKDIVIKALDELER